MASGSSSGSVVPGCVSNISSAASSTRSMIEASRDEIGARFRSELSGGRATRIDVRTDGAVPTTRASGRCELLADFVEAMHGGVLRRDQLGLKLEDLLDHRIAGGLEAAIAHDASPIELS